LFVYIFVYIYHPPSKSRDDPNGNSTDTSWQAVAPRQEGPSHSERLRQYKPLGKTAERAPTPRCARSSKTLAHLRSPLRKTRTPSTTVATLLESSRNPSGPTQANRKIKRQTRLQDLPLSQKCQRNTPTRPIRDPTGTLPEDYWPIISIVAAYRLPTS